MKRSSQTTIHRNRLLSQTGDTHDMRLARKVMAGIFQEVREGKVEPLQMFEALFSVLRVKSDARVWRDEVQRLVLITDS